MNDTNPAQITVNGIARSLSLGATVRDLLGEQLGRSITSEGTAEDGGRLGIAVARNSAVVPRGLWASTVLQPHDAIEIVTAAQGG